MVKIKKRNCNQELFHNKTKAVIKISILGILDTTSIFIEENEKVLKRPPTNMKTYTFNIVTNN